MTDNVECRTCGGKVWISEVVKAADSFDGQPYIRVVRCPDCTPPENVEEPPVEHQPCHTCGDKGQVQGVYWDHMTDEIERPRYVPCPTCTENVEEPCKWCHGNRPPANVVAPPCHRCHGIDRSTPENVEGLSE